MSVGVFASHSFMYIHTHTSTALLRQPTRQLVMIINTTYQLVMIIQPNVLWTNMRYFLGPNTVDTLVGQV